MDKPVDNQGRVPRKPEEPRYGVYRALVVDQDDPEQQGRIRVQLPWQVLPGAGNYEAWARPVAWVAGDSSGAWSALAVGSEVLIAFEGGDPRQPYLIGSLWNEADRPPENAPIILCTRHGVQVTLEDAPGGGRLTLETPQSQTVVLDDASRSVLVMDANGNTITLDSSGITITAAARIKMAASSLEVDAGMLKVNASMSEFSGLVKCDTLVANSVVSSSYTPGAGNIW